MTKVRFSLIVLTLIAFAIVCCKKNNVVIDKEVTAPAFAKFNRRTATDSVSTYLIPPSNAPFKLVIGVTNVASVDRTIQLTYSSNSAVNGVEYNAPTSIVMPAGKAIDTLYITGVNSVFSACATDTVKISIAGGDVGISSYYANYYVILKKNCDESSTSIDLNCLLGSYTNTNETLGSSVYGPYTTKIDQVNQTSPTTGTIRVNNIYDNGWGPITFMLDWTDPANKKVTLMQQSGIAPGDLLDSSIPPSDSVSVRAFAGSDGTFSSCGQQFTLKMQLGYGQSPINWVAPLYTVIMKR